MLEVLMNAVFLPFLHTLRNNWFNLKCLHGAFLG